MLPLSELLDTGKVDVTLKGKSEGVTIDAVTADSREVTAGTLFAAIRGTKIDGTRFIPDAIAKGAVAILSDKHAAVQHDSIPVIESDNVRRDLAIMAGAFYAPHPNHIVAVTGTNGKTSVAEFVRQMLQHNGHHAASLGTLGLRCDDERLSASFPADNTSAEPVLLAKTLQQCAQQKIDYVAIEASSHGLDQYRLDGVSFEAAAFTNLSHEHLDYHADMDAYFAAKARLFLELSLTKRIAVIHADDRYGQALIALCEAKGLGVWSYGREGKTFRILSCEATEQGLACVVEMHGKSHDITLPLYGSFQLQNVLAALGLCMAMGLEKETLLQGLPHLRGAKGRMQRVAELPNGAACFVDYAHTPDALEKLLSALRAHTGNRLHLVFGCGGDRDTQKRPEMGEVAQRLADHVIVTDDNPRSEDPVAIRHEILTACPKAVDIGDRKEAIYAGVSKLQAGDLLVVAGKGHENYQIIGEQTHPFDDSDIIKEAVGSL